MHGQANSYAQIYHEHPLLSRKRNVHHSVSNRQPFWLSVQLCQEMLRFMWRVLYQLQETVFESVGPCELTIFAVESHDKVFVIFGNDDPIAELLMHYMCPNPNRGELIIRKSLLWLSEFRVKARSYRRIGHVEIGQALDFGAVAFLFRGYILLRVE